MKYLMLLSVLFVCNVQAQNAEDLSLADEAISNPSVDIEGQYQIKEEKAAPVAVKEEKIVAPKKVQRKLSQSDRLKMYRERLEERNRIMIEKKMEIIRYRQEVALARQLEASMNQTIKAIDNVK